MITLNDFNNLLLTEMYFHISMSGTDYRKIREFNSNSYLYEFKQDSSKIYKDTLEGYSICGVVTELNNDNLLEVYELGKVELYEVEDYLEEYVGNRWYDVMVRGLDSGSFIKIKPLLNTKLGFTDSEFIVPFTLGKENFIAQEECHRQEIRQFKNNSWLQR